MKRITPCKYWFFKTDKLIGKRKVMVKCSEKELCPECKAYLRGKNETRIHNKRRV